MSLHCADQEISYRETGQGDCFSCLKLESLTNCWFCSYCCLGKHCCTEAASLVSSGSLIAAFTSRLLG